jgi:hypothetical protein
MLTRLRVRAIRPLSPTWRAFLGFRVPRLAPGTYDGEASRATRSKPNADALRRTLRSSFSRTLASYSG